MTAYKIKLFAFIFCKMAVICTTYSLGRPFLFEKTLSVKNDCSVNENTRNIDSVSVEFLKEAAIYNKMEIQIGLLAQERVSDAEIKAFANKLVDYHKINGSKLANIASEKGIPYTEELSSHCKDDIAKLFKLKGFLFEKSYLNLVEENHRKSIAVYKKAATKSLDSKIRAFAASTIPDLEAHNGSAKLLNRSVRTSKL